MGIGGAIIGSSVLGAGASLFGSSRASKAARQAGDVQAQAALESARVQEKMFEQTREDLAPFREFGKSALSSYSDIVLRGELEKFRESPGYQFRLGEGLKAIDRATAAGGGLGGGAHQKALMRFGQGLASEEYQNYLNQLAYPIGVSQASAAQTAAAAPQFSSQIGSSLMQAGAGRASGLAGAANIRSQGIGQAAGFIGSGLREYAQHRAFEQPMQYPSYSVPFAYS